MPDFQNPTAFLFLLLIPLLYLLRRIKLFSRISFPAVLSDWNGKGFEWDGKSHQVLSVLSSLLLILAFFLMILALADPVVSRQEKVFTTLGTDIVFVVDTSPSMAAKDVDGQTRILAAKNTVKELVAAHEGSRFGLVCFASDSAVLVPPTGDAAAFATALDSVQVGTFGNGSAIGDGLSTAICHLASSSAPKKCIVLFTDGENNAGEIHPETAAALARDNGIVLYAVGIGTKGRVPLEYTDPSSGKLYSGYLDSDFDSAPLRKLVSIGAGRYFEVRTTEELKSTLGFIARTESVSQSFTYRTVTYTLYKKFVLAAIILLLTAWFIKGLVLKEIIAFTYRRRFFLRFVFFPLALVCLLTAYSGISWGTYLVPVTKSGTAVSFVFDVSNSMLAEDGPSGMTRLKSAALYARRLLSKMQGTSVSVVLAKGDGTVIIPLTEDKAGIEALLEVLSPALMSSPGTSLGKGIAAARGSFPKNYSYAGRIWVFTDGEETDGSLASALTDCINSGIPVSVVGFGSQSGAHVLAGDGKTVVTTALRAKAVEDAIVEAQSKSSFFRAQPALHYIDSQERASAARLLSQLPSGEKPGEAVFTSYEAKPIPRYKLFLLLAVVFFVTGYVLTEFDFVKYFRLSKKQLFGTLVLPLALLLSGCSHSETYETAQGVFACGRKQYRKAVSSFLNATETALAANHEAAVYYSLYNLGAAYSMLDEDDAAMEKFLQVGDSAPDAVRYASYYNAGILAHRNAKYDEAASYFRKALEIDGTKLDAKINLELSVTQAQTNARHNESTALPAAEEKSDTSDIEKAVFEHIKENDQKQWKNSETAGAQQLADDY